MKITWSYRGRNSLKEIVEYLVQEDLEAARRVRGRIIEKTNLLKENPYIGLPYEMNTRRLPLGDYWPPQGGLSALPKQEPDLAMTKLLGTISALLTGLIGFPLSVAFGSYIATALYFFLIGSLSLESFSKGDLAYPYDWVLMVAATLVVDWMVAATLVVD